MPYVFFVIYVSFVIYVLYVLYVFFVFYVSFVIYVLYVLYVFFVPSVLYPPSIPKTFPRTPSSNSTRASTLAQPMCGVSKRRCGSLTERKG